MIADKLKIITRAWSDLYNMLDDADLKKAGLSLSDYSECKRLIALLGAPGNKAETVIEKAAGYFEKHGYTVTESGIGYQITV